MNRHDVLWIGFGGLWIVDGVLQAQSAMYTPRFVTDVLQPVAQGQPAWVVGLLLAATRLWQSSAVAANVAAVLVELAIGALFLIGRGNRLGRLGLFGSIVWGLVIWVFGEGLGGILAGSPSALTGSPGAVLAYLAAAILLLLPPSWWQLGTVVRWTRRALGAFWLLAAAAQAWPVAGFWTADGFGWTFQAAANQPQPAVISTGIVDVASLVVRQPVLANALFVSVMVVLGGVLLIGLDNLWVYGLALLWLGFSWWIGQDFGAIFSGAGTDPGMALPLALLTVAVAPALRPENAAPQVAGFGKASHRLTRSRVKWSRSAAFLGTTRWAARLGQVK